MGEGGGRGAHQSVGAAPSLIYPVRKGRIHDKKERELSLVDGVVVATYIHSFFQGQGLFGPIFGDGFL